MDNPFLRDRYLWVNERDHPVDPWGDEAKSLFEVALFDTREDALTKGPQGSQLWLRRITFIFTKA
jgi:hypothetical protein